MGVIIFILDANQRSSHDIYKLKTNDLAKKAIRIRLVAFSKFTVNALLLESPGANSCPTFSAILHNFASQFLLNGTYQHMYISM